MFEIKKEEQNIQIKQCSIKSHVIICDKQNIRFKLCPIKSHVIFSDKQNIRFKLCSKKSHVIFFDKQNIYSSRFEITYRLRVFYVDVSMLLFYVKLDKFIHDI